MLASLSQPGKGQLLELAEVSEEQAKSLLDTGDVAGVVKVNEKIELVVRQSGIEESILKAILDEYVFMSRTVMRVLANNPAAVREITDRKKLYRTNLVFERQS